MPLEPTKPISGSPAPTLLKLPSQLRHLLRKLLQSDHKKMYLVTWSQRYSIGIDEIDGHHRHLIYLLNKTYDVFVNKTPGWDLAEVFAALTDYTQYHFSAEEELMRKCRFPDLTAHEKRHDQFVKRLTSMQESFNCGKRQLSFELLTFLNTWLLSHILDADANFGKFFAAPENQLAA